MFAGEYELNFVRRKRLLRVNEVSLVSEEKTELKLDVIVIFAKVSIWERKENGRGLDIKGVNTFREHDDGFEQLDIRIKETKRGTRGVNKRQLE